MMRGKTGAETKGEVGRRSSGHRVMLVAAVLMLVGGLAALYWSDIADFASQMEFDRQIATIDQVHDEIEDTQKSDDAFDADETKQELSERAASYAAALPRFEAYNEGLRSGAGQRVNDPFAGNDVQESLAASGVADDLLGAISIPSIGCKLPLYFGATSENMAKGATVVTGTSLPLGQTSSNCVIAAHRGYARAAMFRDIEDIQLGDTVTITTPWNTLVYRAAAFKVIRPNDVSSVLIQPGKDLVTLLTCHPYGRNVTRYLVICERSDAQLADAANNETPGVAALDTENAATDEDAPQGLTTLQAERLMKRGVTIVLVLALVLIMGLTLHRRMKRRRSG